MNSSTTSSDSSAAPESAPKPASRRLMSLDALRGFDMFWIIGADSLVQALRRMNDGWLVRGVASQLEHKDWAGFAFYDLIFPLFVFIVGVSLVFSLTKTMEQAGKAAALQRVFRRSALLFALAIVYSGGVSREWPDIRLMGVLNRIALCYFFAALIFCFFRWRGMLAICAALLAGYWALMTFVPFPDVRPTPGGTQIIAKETGFTNIAQLNMQSTNRIAGVFVKGVNLANYLDQQYLPGKKWDGTWDPEGLLSTLPAIGTCLLGVFAGLLLMNQSISDQQKVLYLIGGGMVAVGVGFLWGLQFPVIKKIWTSSYVLVAGGYSAILLGVFFLVVDVWKYQKWAQPFVWIGMNSITVYLANNIIDFDRFALRFVGGDVRNFFEARLARGFGDFIIALAGLGLGVLLCYFLHRRRIFLRL
ncbi:MAG: heparan-alpha-glucosaminide N-acetyltransferase domain-containing protein [Verrucomicrobiota bacterium]